MREPVAMTKKVVIVGLAGFRGDRPFVGIDMLGRIDDETYPAVEHFALVAE